MEYISTTSLANSLGVSATDLFEKLFFLGWIERKFDKWCLTKLGKEKGGQMRTSNKFGEYIVWPDNISIDTEQQKDRTSLLNATAIGQHFNISSQRLNLILSELGWIEKDITGWNLTNLGRRRGGRQYEHDVSGGAYVLWPSDVIENKSLKSVFSDTQLYVSDKKVEEKQITPSQLTANIDNFRDKFPPTLRTKDGHMVRSRAEVIIDNALYDYKLAHAYERKLPIEEDVYSDFFIPSENVYVEYWGMEEDAKYAERKKIKIEIYKKYGFKLIELFDQDIQNLDDYLPKKLLKFGIKVY